MKKVSLAVKRAKPDAKDYPNLRWDQLKMIFGLKAMQNPRRSLLLISNHCLGKQIHWRLGFCEREIGVPWF
jgi:hypothetical protein